MLDATSYTFMLPEPSAHPSLVLRTHLPATYPTQHPPVFELSCDFLSADMLGGLAAELEGLFSPGAPVCVAGALWRCRCPCCVPPGACPNLCLMPHRRSGAVAVDRTPAGALG